MVLENRTLRRNRMMALKQLRSESCLKPERSDHMNRERMRNFFVAITVCLTLVLSSGCASTGSGNAMNKSETGLSVGAGMGALLGQTSGGNEAGNKEARIWQATIEQDTWPLANTTWQVVSVNPKPAEPMKSKVGRFNADGTLTTTTTYWDGRTVMDADSEHYRIVGQTLIINQDDYVINATFRLDGDSLYMDTGTHSLVLERIWTVAILDNGR
jgi:hypothetical protein